MGGEAGVPGGDPAELYKLADTLDQHAGKVGDLGANMLTTTQSIRSAANWTGTASNSYNNFTGNTAHKIGDFEAPIKNVSSAIRTYAAALQKAQNDVRSANAAANNAVQAKDPNAQSHVDAANKAASDAADQVKQAGDLAAGEVEGSKSGFDEFIEKLEPFAKANEWAHMPTDITMTDHLIDKALEKWAKSAEGKLDSAKDAKAALDSSLKDAFSRDVGSVAHDFDNGAASMEDVEAAFTKYKNAAVTATAAADGAVDGAQSGLTLAKVAGAASKGFSGLAIAGDAYTLIHPPDEGVHGTVDRVAAGANAAGITTALVAANASADWIPGVGEVVAGGTGLYLAGNALYHIPAVHHFVNHVGSSIGHAASSAAHWVANIF